MILAFLTPILMAMGAALTVLLPFLSAHWRQQSPQRLSLLMLLALGAGFLAGSASMLPGWWQNFPPPDSTLWLLFGWPLCVALSLWQSFKNRPWWASALLVLLPGLLFGWLVLAPMRLQGWSPLLCLGLATGYACGLLLISLLPAQSARQTGSHWLYATVVLMLLTASCPLFLLGSSALLTQQAAMLAGLQMIPMALLLWQPEIPVSGLLTLNSFSLAGLWLNACLFTDTKPWSVALLLLLLSPALLRLKPLAKRSPRFSQGLILALNLLVLSTLVTALWLTRSQDLYFG